MQLCGGQQKYACTNTTTVASSSSNNGVVALAAAAGSLEKNTDIIDDSLTDIDREEGGSAAEKERCLRSCGFVISSLLVLGVSPLPLFKLAYCIWKTSYHRRLCFSALEPTVSTTRGSRSSRPMILVVYARPGTFWIARGLAARVTAQVS